MVLSTPFTKAFNLSVPVCLAPCLGISGGRLAGETQQFFRKEPHRLFVQALIAQVSSFAGTRDATGGHVDIVGGLCLK